MKKGFTLVELIGVMVIVGLISLVGVPTMTRTLKKTNEDEEKRVLIDFYLATENYIEGNRDNFPTLKETGGVTYISLNELKNTGYIRANIVNPQTDEVFDYTTAVRVYRNEDGTLDYEYSSDYYGVDGYASDGLIVHFDALNNQGIGKFDADADTWKDLSGNNNDGVINGPNWSDEIGLAFDGVDDWVSIGELNYQNFTLEATMINDEYQSGEREIVVNYQGGGYGLSIYDGKLGGQAKIDSTWRSIKSSSENNYGTTYDLSITYDGNTLIFYVNGQIIGQQQISGEIDYPNNSTIMTLGTNPNGSASVDCFFKGKIYSVKMYSRALTADEVKYNYEVDKLRFNME